MEIPSEGKTRASVMEALRAFKEGDLATHGGTTWAYVFDPGRREIEAVGREAHGLYLSENALDPTAFPSVLRMENEVVAMAAAHLGGDDEVAGTFTSGGTESCLLAVKTARDMVRAQRPEVVPEMVLPVTAHAAFFKAAHYLGVKAVAVPVDPDTFRAVPDAMAGAINEHTVLMVASAPSYAHGVVDPIEELAEVARAHDVLFHVDGCIGGFLLPLWRDLGVPVPAFDFQVPGVTSISMDFHKYAFCPKGASVILYRNRQLRLHQFFAWAEWTGYTVVNPTVQSTKSAGPLAATWAVLNHVGRKGYLELAKEMLEATRALVAGIETVPGLRILGEPDMTLIAVASDEVDVFHVVDEMAVRGWHVQPQFAYGGSPPSIHLTVTPVSRARVDAFLKDLREATDTARTLPRNPVVDVVRQAAQALQPGQVTPEVLQQFMTMAGVTGTSLPERTATINAILDALPRPLTAHVLAAFLNEMFMLREE